MITFKSIKLKFHSEPKAWLITGLEGYIQITALKVLLKFSKRILDLDNFK